MLNWELDFAVILGNFRVGVEQNWSDSIILDWETFCVACFWILWRFIKMINWYWREHFGMEDKKAQNHFFFRFLEITNYKKWKDSHSGNLIILRAMPVLGIRDQNDLHRFKCLIEKYNCDTNHLSYSLKIQEQNNFMSNLYIVQFVSNKFSKLYHLNVPLCVLNSIHNKWDLIYSLSSKSWK